MITSILVLIIMGCALGTSGCTMNTSQIPTNGKYNTINQTIGEYTIWNNDTCPMCETPKAAAQKQDNNMNPKLCLRCGYKFYTVSK